MSNVPLNLIKNKEQAERLCEKLKVRAEEKKNEFIKIRSDLKVIQKEFNLQSQ